MTYTIKHTYVDQALDLTLSKQGDLATVACSLSGLVPIRFPGKLVKAAVATYYIHVLVEDVASGPGAPRPPRWETQTKRVPVAIDIRTPDDQPFTLDHVTIPDLQRFRDLRGVSLGSWSFHAHGQDPPVPVDNETSRVTLGKGYISIVIEETVTSKSAPPLVSGTMLIDGTTGRSYGLDLYRVGTFIATAASETPSNQPPRLSLIDPGGTTVATSTSGRLTHPITLETLDQSRDHEGMVRRWRLHVGLGASGARASAQLAALAGDGIADLLAGATRPEGGRRAQTPRGSIDPDVRARPGGPIGDDPLPEDPEEPEPPSERIRVWASVDETARIRTQLLQDRIDFLIGERGSKLSLFGEMKDQRLLARLKILDLFSAETIDMHGLLDSVIGPVPQDEGVSAADIEANVAYNLANESSDLGYEMHVSLDGVRVTTIDITVGASERIQPAIAALKIALGIEGTVTVKLGGFPFATVKVQDNVIRAEVGVRLGLTGAFESLAWIKPDLVDVDVHWAAALAAGIVSDGILVLGAIGVAEYIQHRVNSAIVDGLKEVLTGLGTSVPRVLAVVLGDDFTIREMRLEGDSIVFEYVAPVEPEPKPSPIYTGVIGRDATLGLFGWDCWPRSLGDTWAAPNLGKIDHIVVVMMENRSFDQVLGYRAQLPGGQGVDGLTDALTGFLKTAGFTVRKLRESGIAANELGLKTRFPEHVGHKYDDVTQQVSVQIATDTGRPILSPKGFIENFAPRAAGHPELVVDDVLGYYDQADLPFFAFLADNYAFCGQYYCSHAGPTLPNRMLSLAGDLQYDRTGEALIDNNNQDNFFLSRAMTVFDLLTRKRIGWRVYESFPSVTMLRMFARYATDDTHIVPISRLQADVAAGNLPSVTVIEPAMHHFPPNDDHPVADMHRGQLFLKGVYDTLRSNEALWRKTMLIITYDEHGGFYDHVVPPIAECRGLPEPVLDPGDIPTLRSQPFIPSTHVTCYGVRVPTFVVSPYAPAGMGPNKVLDHCSILKTIVARFCSQHRPFVSDRVEWSHSFDSYLSEPAPRMNVPASPPMQPLPVAAMAGARTIVTSPLSRRQMRAGNVDYHDLTGMLARMLGR